MSSRLYVVFGEGVAGYVEEKRRRRCRQTNESSREAMSSAKNVALAV
ncbi:MAG: hypothetical protein SPI30_07610 [Prevotella sp.]|nr:hypothetical protein [Prevotella sp.]